MSESPRVCIETRMGGGERWFLECFFTGLPGHRTIHENLPGHDRKTGFPTDVSTETVDLLIASHGGRESWSDLSAFEQAVLDGGVSDYWMIVVNTAKALAFDGRYDVRVLWWFD